jgi:hypothetical protein
MQNGRQNQYKKAGQALSKSGKIGGERSLKMQRHLPEGSAKRRWLLPDPRPTARFLSQERDTSGLGQGACRVLPRISAGPHNDTGPAAAVLERARVVSLPHRCTLWCNDTGMKSRSRPSHGAAP